MSTDWEAYYNDVQKRKGITPTQPAAKKAAPKSAKTKGHDYKADFIRDLGFLGLPLPSHGAKEYGCLYPEHQFHDSRKWRIDFAYPLLRIAIEYSGLFGGEGQDASHRALAGILRDCEKYTELSLAGWTLIIINAKTVQSGQAVTWLETALKNKGIINGNRNAGQ